MVHDSYYTSFTLCRYFVSSFASQGPSAILCAPGQSLFDKRLRGEVYSSSLQPLSLCACVLFLPVLSSFLSQSLYPRMNSLGKTVELPTWKGIRSIDELICLELRWRLWNRRPLCLNNSLWKGLCIPSGRLRMACVGGIQLVARSLLI